MIVDEPFDRALESSYEVGRRGARRAIESFPESLRAADAWMRGFMTISLIHLMAARGAHRVTSVVSSHVIAATHRAQEAMEAFTSRAGTAVQLARSSGAMNAHGLDLAVKVLIDMGAARAERTMEEYPPAPEAAEAWMHGLLSELFATLVAQRGPRWVAEMVILELAIAREAYTVVTAGTSCRRH